MRFYNVKKIIARILIVAMILSSNGFYAFAEGVTNDIQVTEESKEVVEGTENIAPTNATLNEDAEIFGDGEYEDEPEEESVADDETTTDGELLSSDEPEDDSGEMPDNETTSEEENQDDQTTDESSDEETITT